MASFARTDEVKKIPKEPPKEWYSLTDAEKYECFMEAIERVANLNRRLAYKIILLEDAKETIIAQKKVIDKRFIPKWGFSVNTSLGLDYQLEKDFIVESQFYIFFLKGRLILTPSAYIKFFDNIGGGVGIGLGITF
jgi:hypothetical protein